jgi:hypothetical protein
MQKQFSDLGFTHITAREVVKPQSVMCCETLGNESLKKNKLKRHFETKHNAFVGNERSFLMNNRLKGSGWMLQTTGSYAVCNKLHWLLVTLIGDLQSTRNHQISMC